MLAMSLIGLTYLLVFIFIHALYHVGIKYHYRTYRTTITNNIIMLFWANVFAYLGFLSFYFIKSYWSGSGAHEWRKLVYVYTDVNVPLYLLLAVAFVGSIILYSYLATEYEISIIVALAQFSLLFKLFGYTFLGNSFTLGSLIGVLGVFLGALIFPLKQINWKRPLESFKEVSTKLYLGSLGRALLSTIVAMVTFSCTQDHPETEVIMHALQHMEQLTFSFFDPFHFTMGVWFFVVVVFFFVLILARVSVRQIYRVLQEDTIFVVIIGFLYFISLYFHQQAYYFIENKLLFTSLTKLRIPLVVLFASLFLHEKITWPKGVGVSLIVLGGMISALYG